MMIDPEGFYEYEHKEKIVEKIMTVIRNLKRRMGKLKNVMEHPDYCSRCHPSEDVQLAQTRRHLEKAKEALAEAGGVYQPSKAELAASAFDENLSAIREIRYSLCGLRHAPEIEKHVITIEEDGPHRNGKRFQIANAISSIFDPESVVDTQTFLEALRELHIGEWRRSYSAERFRMHILDGVQWEVEFRFSNGFKSVKIHGCNVYPYNFDEFLEILGLDPL